MLRKIKMKKESLIKEEISQVKNNEVKLYSYLYDLIYKETVSDINFLEGVFRQFIDDERDEIKRIAIYALLFALKLKAVKYKEVALQYARNTAIDFDLRLTCISSLAEAYMGSNDPHLLGILFQIFNDKTDDEDIRAESFIGVLKLLGMTTSEIAKVNQNRVIVSFTDINLSCFDKQLARVKEYL